jgi:UDP-N-acetylglucosamine acyltransferase
MRHFDPMIHLTAIIDPKAEVDPTVRVGPYAVIDGGVKLGANCIVGPNVYLTGQTTIGSDNVFHAGCVIGDEPVDVKYKGEPTRLRIGDHNIIREHVTVNCACTAEGETVLGSHNFLTPHCHIGHNVQVGDHTIIGGGAMVAGYAVIQNGAFISGNCLVHQFCRVGALAIMQGGSAISQDLPPFTVLHRMNEICGLNVVGLRRAGFTAEQRMELKRLYRLLFRSGKNLRAAVEEAKKTFTSPAAKTLLDFVAETKRGVCSDPGGAADDNE